jgi:hypothetical protein
MVLAAAPQVGPIFPQVFPAVPVVALVKMLWVPLVHRAKVLQVVEHSQLAVTRLRAAAAVLVPLE